jgi:hypothetical protein
MRQVSSLKKQKSFLNNRLFFLLQTTLFNDKCIYIDTDTSKRERIKSEYIRMNVEC